MAAAKYLSVPLLIGLPFAVSWPRMGSRRPEGYS